MSTDHYEAPVIQKLQGGFMNKFGNGAGYARKICKAIDGVTIDDLVEQFGSPLFVFSEQRIRKQYREVYDAFSRQYPNLVLAWSYKTNYLNAILRHHAPGRRICRSGVRYGICEGLRPRNSGRPDHL